jgi:predicted PolB exonuclease-like 3'-5' exonuclease
MAEYSKTDTVCRCCRDEKELVNESPFCKDCYVKIKYAPSWGENFKKIIYYAEHKEEIKEKNKKYRMAHKEMYAASHRKYIEKNKEKWNNYQREYRKRKKEEIEAKLARLAELEAQQTIVNS